MSQTSDASPSQKPGDTSSRRRSRLPFSNLSFSSLLHLSFFILISLPAIQPLLGADFTCGYDNTFHLWRAVEIEHLLEQGVLFSRWAPNMAHGYGYPLFNFSASLSAYGPALLNILGVSWGWAMNLVFVGGWILSAMAMYGFVTDLFRSRWAGAVAAVLYTYAPFHAYDVFQRGSLSQASAWFYPPLVLWALRRADRRGGFVVAALGTAGLLLTHNAFALFFVPICLGYLWAVAKERELRIAVRGGAAILLGMGLSAFFWAPALLELRFVNSDQLSEAWVFDFTNNFLPLDQLFALPHVADPALINDWPARGLGLVALVASLAGLLALKDRSRRRSVAFFALVLGACLFLISPVSQQVWNAIPLLQQVQFPWRLVGPATLCAAILAGAAVHAIAPRWRRFVAPLFLAVLLLTHLGWFYPRHCSPPGDISVAGMIEWERQTDTIGTTAGAEFLPIWVERMPEGTVPEGQIRFGAEALPAGSSILEEDYGVNRATVVVDAPASFQARYLAFYYPGWRVRIDGKPVNIAPSDPQGLITFDVPSGRHTISIRFGEPPLRFTADAIAIVSAVFLLLCFLAPLLPCSVQLFISQPSTSNLQSPVTVIPTLLILSVLIALLKIAVIDRVPNPLRHSNLAGDQLLRVDVPSGVTFDGQFRLLGYDALPTSVPGDEAITVGTYWRDGVPGGPNYWVGLSLRDADGLTWHVPDLRPPRWHRPPPEAYLWPPDQYARIAYQLQPLPGIPPGTYTVALGVFDRNSLRPFSAQDANGQTLGLEVDLGQLSIERPSGSISLDEVSPQYATGTDLGPVRLVGYNVDREEAVPGNPFLLTLFWRALDAPGQDLSICLTLLDSSGEEAISSDLAPVPHFPTTGWDPGDLWRGQHLLRLPAGLESGVHRWRLELCEGTDCDAFGDPVALSDLLIQAPERIWETPSLDLATDAQLGDVATLLGAIVEPATCNLQSATCNLQSSTSNLHITLAWRSETETPVSYRVFLHLLGADGVSVAQSDGEPAGWTRPTTGWLPGEVVLDQRVLDLPAELAPGEYRLVAGLYTLEGGRLVNAQGDDGVLLGVFTVNQE